MAAVDTWLYVREGRDAPSFEEITKSYEKFIPEADRPKMQEDKPAGASALLADGSEPVDQIFAKAQCMVCHTIPGIPGATGTQGPKLEEGTERTDPNQGSGVQGNCAQHSRIHHGIGGLSQHLCREGIS